MSAEVAIREGVDSCGIPRQAYALAEGRGDASTGKAALHHIVQVCEAGKTVGIEAVGEALMSILVHTGPSCIRSDTDDSCRREFQSEELRPL